MTVHRLEIAAPNYSAQNTSTMTAFSSHLKGRGDISIYREPSNNKNVPIIVLLHGVYGSHWVWSQLGGVDKVYQDLRAQGLPEFVLVMPSDGAHQQGSGYLALQNADYEKWIVEDVISAAIISQAMCSKNSNIYITGLSMGGYGALRLGAKYPHVFSGISAHSAITELNDFKHFVEDETLQPLRKTCDPYQGDVFKTLHANKANLPPLRFDCGRDDVLINANNALAEKLTEANIAYSYQVFDGEHSWQYWHQHITDTLLFFAELERANVQ